VFDEAEAHERAQHALDHRTKRAVHSGEPHLVDTEEFLEVLLDQTE